MIDINQAQTDLMQAIENIVMIWYQGASITETEIRILLEARDAFNRISFLNGAKGGEKC